MTFISSLEKILHNCVKIQREFWNDLELAMEGEMKVAIIWNDWVFARLKTLDKIGILITSKGTDHIWGTATFTKSILFDDILNTSFLCCLSINQNSKWEFSKLWMSVAPNISCVPIFIDQKPDHWRTVAFPFYCEASTGCNVNSRRAY